MKTFKEPLSSKEEMYYLKCFKDGDLKGREVLVEHNLRLVAYIAKKYISADNGRSLEELISIGTIGLMKAIDSFDTEKGKLSTYAARCIENEYLMMLRGERKRQKDVSLYNAIGSDGDGNEINFMDIIESEGPLIEEQCETNEDIRKLTQCIDKILNPRELLIVAKRYGLYGNEEHTQQQVADELNISRSYVSRIEKKALEKLREVLS